MNDMMIELASLKCMAEYMQIEGGRMKKQDRKTLC
jgi:hypothetical protein